MNVDLTELAQYKETNSDIIPLHHWNKKVSIKGETVERGKTPIQKGWTKGLFNPELALKKIEEGYNVGYRLHDDDLIIDVDPRNYKDGVDSLAELEKWLGLDLLDVYPCVNTGSGGFHFYCKKDPKILTQSALADYPGIDFKSKGGQVVCAGSKHPNGEMYRWDDFSVDLNDRPKAPKKLLKKLKKDMTRNSEDSVEGVLTCEQLEMLLEQIPVEDFGEGSNDSWFPLLCSAHHATDGDGIDAFVRWSTSHEDFTNEEHMIRTRWDSLGGKQLNYTVATLYKNVKAYGGETDIISAQSDFRDIDEIDEDDELDDDLDDEVVKVKENPKHLQGLALKYANLLRDNSPSEEVMKAIRASVHADTLERIKAQNLICKTMKYTKSELKQIVKELTENELNDLVEDVAKLTLDKHYGGGKELLFNNSNEFWEFDKTHWSPVTKEWIGKKVKPIVYKLLSDSGLDAKVNSTANEVVHSLSFEQATKGDAMRRYEKPYPIINCKNGELWINKKGEMNLKPHNPKSRQTQVLDVTYDPGAECPMFDKALDVIFRRFPDKEDMIRHMWEFMGYVIYPEKDPPHWWLFKGKGGDGKSMIMEVVSGLLGEACIMASITRFSGRDTHATAELPGKLLLYDDDLDSNTKLPDGELKKLSGGGSISANPKGRDGFTFVPVCTPVLCANGEPKMDDLTHGFRRRAMVIPFGGEVPAEDRIKGLSTRIKRKELNGVLNKILVAMKRLRTRGAFDEPASCTTAKRSMLSEGNPVAKFLEDSVEITHVHEDRVTLTDMYTAFTNCSYMEGVKTPMTNQNFRKKMTDMGVVYGDVGNRRQFFGVKLLEQPSEFDDLDDLDDELDD